MQCRKEQIFAHQASDTLCICGHYGFKMPVSKLGFPKIILTQFPLVLFTGTCSHATLPALERSTCVRASRCLGTNVANTWYTSKPTSDKNRHTHRHTVKRWHVTSLHAAMEETTLLLVTVYQLG